MKAKWLLTLLAIVLSRASAFDGSREWRPDIMLGGQERELASLVDGSAVDDTSAVGGKSDFAGSVIGSALLGGSNYHPHGVHNIVLSSVDGHTRPMVASVKDGDNLVELARLMHFKVAADHELSPEEVECHVTGALYDPEQTCVNLERIDGEDLKKMKIICIQNQNKVIGTFQFQKAMSAERGAAEDRLERIWDEQDPGNIMRSNSVRMRLGWSARAIPDKKESKNDDTASIAPTEIDDTASIAPTEIDDDGQSEDSVQETGSSFGLLSDDEIMDLDRQEKERYLLENPVMPQYGYESTTRVKSERSGIEMLEPAVQAVSILPVGYMTKALRRFRTYCSGGSKDLFLVLRSSDGRSPKEVSVCDKLHYVLEENREISESLTESQVSAWLLESVAYTIYSVIKDDEARHADAWPVTATLEKIDRAVGEDSHFVGEARLLENKDVGRNPAVTHMYVLLMETVFAGVFTLDSEIDSFTMSREIPK